ncbi:MAG: hypothetical protein KAH25_07050 [Bacteroidales bacterium]|nr:hypothetical protein [Bacteroidales bacterium]
MNSRKKWYTALVGITVILFLSVSCKKDKDPETIPEKTYNGTLTVLQKDAYSDVAGRSSDLWPPHTTTVFKWENGEEVQLNHGTAPEETDANGDLFLVEAKVYSFSGTKNQMEALQTKFTKAIYDDATHHFLNLTDGTAVLEQSFLLGLKAYMDDGANGLIMTGLISKDSLISLFESGDYYSFGSALPNCNWTQSHWITAFETVLGDVFGDLGHNLEDYHVCNDDAYLQVGLIKNYMSTGKIEIPEKLDDGPMMFYTPE